MRQYYAYKLITEYGYDKEQLSLEEPVLIAGKTIDTDKRIDIAVFDSEHKKIQMIIEVKRPRITNYHKIGRERDQRRISRCIPIVVRRNHS